MLGTDNLKYKYRDSYVLDGVSVEIRPGEVFGILGRNGSGKTTLLKNLNRNLSPESGAVMLDGENLKDLDKKTIARSVSVVPQGNEIRFSFTVEDIVSMGRSPFQKQFGGESSEDIRIIEDAMRDTGILEMRHRPVSEMSGGERQKVIIARAIAQTPKYLLMDEPTNHLDINTQFEILDLVTGLAKKKGICVVIVSHDLPMAARYCDRMALIKDRRILCCGPPEDVLTPENMRDVFLVDAVLSINPANGKRTVILNGSVKSRSAYSRDSEFSDAGDHHDSQNYPEHRYPRQREDVVRQAAQGFYSISQRVAGRDYLKDAGHVLITHQRSGREIQGHGDHAAERGIRVEIRHIQGDGHPYGGNRKAEKGQNEVHYDVVFRRMNRGADEYRDDQYHRRLEKAAYGEERDLPEQDAFPRGGKGQEFVQIPQGFVEHYRRAGGHSRVQHRQHKDPGGHEVQIVFVIRTDRKH